MFVFIISILASMCCSVLFFYYVYKKFSTNENKYTKYIVRVLVGFLISMLLAIVGVMADSKPQTSEKKEEKIYTSEIISKEKEKSNKVKLSPQEDFVKKLEQKQNFINLEKPFEDTYIIRFKLESNYSKKAMVENTAVQSTDLLSLISKNEELKSKIELLTIDYIAKFSDVYGNEKEEVAVSYFFTKDKINKINFENFNWKNLPKIADSYYVHPSAR